MVKRNKLGQLDFSSTATYTSSLEAIRSSNYAGIKSSTLDIRTVTNPTGSFPRRKDPMADIYLARDAKAAVDLFEKTAPYLQPFARKHLDNESVVLPAADFAQAGDFGILGFDKKDDFRRAYRELQANSMFYTPKPEPPPPLKPTRSNNYARPPSPGALQSSFEKTSSEYILLRSDQLSEIRELSDLITKEKSILSRAARQIFTQQTLSARIPMPVSLMAVTDVCRSEMSESQSLLRIVLRVDTSKEKVPRGTLKVDTSKSGWSGIEEAGYVADRTMKGKYVTRTTKWPSTTVGRVDVAKMNSMPLAVRPSWYLKIRETKERELREFECETMMVEETVQRLSWRYIEAKNRLDDYKAYYDLAVRYGAFSEEDFHKYPMPGKRYSDLVTRGVRSWQRMWWARWPPRRMCMDICATRMQALWRGIKVRKRWRPIVRMRMHHGRFAICIRCFRPWVEWVKKMKRAKKLCGKILLGATRVTFGGWKSYVMAENERRQDIAKKAMKRFLMRREFSCFSAWFTYVEKKKRILTMMKRAIGNPAFKIWLDYVDQIKEEKFCLRMFTKLQAMQRASVAREEYCCLIRLMSVMRKLVRTKKAVNFVGAALSALVENQERKRMDQELADAVGEEEKRLEEFTKEFDKVESGIRKIKMMQLKTRKGKKELAELTTAVYNKHNSKKKFPKKDKDGNIEEVKKVTMKESEDIARARMLNSACDAARLQMRHDFESKRPPKIQSCDYANPQVFIYEEHYLQKCPDFADIDLCLKNATGSKLFELYVDRIHGVAAEKFSINFWQHVSKWKKTASDSEEYRDEAVAVFNNHLDASAMQPAHLDKELRERIGVHLMKIEIQEDKKDEIEETKKKGGVTGFLTRFQKVEETTLRADIFDEAVFSIVLWLKMNCWTGFLASNLGAEYEEYVAGEKKKARDERVGSYLVERRMKAMEETKDVKAQLKDMKGIMEHQKMIMMQTQECALELELEHLVTEAIDEHCKEEEAKVMAKEMANFAAVDNMVAMFMKSLESMVCEEMIDRTVDVLVEERVAKMTEKKAYDVMRAFEEPFLDSLFDDWFKKRVNQWFVDGDHLTREEKEEKRFAVMFQTRARGFLARKNCRKMASERFVRMWDDWGRSYYWLDQVSQATSWEQPCKFMWKAVDKSIIKHIAPPRGPPGMEIVEQGSSVDYGGSWSYDEYGSQVEGSYEEGGDYEEGDYEEGDEFDEDEEYDEEEEEEEEEEEKM